MTAQHIGSFASVRRKPEQAHAELNDQDILMRTTLPILMKDAPT